MQTIRIYRKGGGLVFSVSGAVGTLETAELHALYPESAFHWLR